MKRLAVAAIALAALGCAKFPGTGAGANTRIHVTMTVAGHIKPNYIYVVAFRWAKTDPPFDPDHGPIPIITSPWSNGIVAGRANVFVQWDSFKQPNYEVDRFTDPVPDNAFPGNTPYLTHYIATGVPINYVDPGDNGNTIEFDLDLSQIAPSNAEIPQLRNLQINFLTMDRVPQGGDSGSKIWDALGTATSNFGVNDFITVSLDRNGTYSNSTLPLPNLEPIHDVPDPDLDIKDWSVQISLP